MSYDSRPATWEHIHQVGALLMQCAVDLQMRAMMHDLSKLEDPELAVFDEYTPKLRELTYGSDEYKAALEGMGDGLRHHYAENRHHPEHWPNGIADMSLLDLLEMLCDWVAATMRHNDGDIKASIKQNAERFGYGPEMTQLLENTLREMIYE